MNNERTAFTLIELMVVIAIIGLLIMLGFPGMRTAFQSASLAVSATNLRNLAVAGAAYQMDHQSSFWRFRENIPDEGVRWWYGLEPMDSLRAGEGNRWFNPDKGPLGGYMPVQLSPDRSFASTGRPFKPKYRFGYIGAGYNVLLADADGNRMRGWMGTGTPACVHSLSKPEELVVFATSAQVNTFQRPASPSNPMIEEFYGIDDREVTVHFRHRDQAMVAFANGAAGLLDADPTTFDSRAPDARVGRFAPVGNTRFLR